MKCVHLIRTNVTVALLAMVGVGFLESQTRAAVQVVTIAESPSLVNYSEREIQIPQFNPSLGTLQSITVDFQATGAFLPGFNRQPKSADNALTYQTPSQHLDLFIEDMNHDRIMSLNRILNQGFAPAGENNASPTPAAHPNQIMLTGSRTLNSDNDLMHFTGSGLVDLFLSAESGIAKQVPLGQSSSRGFWKVGADVKVTYNFTPIPETSTMLAGGFAILVIAGSV